MVQLYNRFFWHKRYRWYIGNFRLRWYFWFKWVFWYKWYSRYIW